MKRSPIFRSADEIYHADTCEAVRNAAARGDIRLVTLSRGTYPGELLPERDLREISTVGYWDVTFEQAWGLDWHRNEGLEIGYVSRGRLAFSVDDESYRLEPGSLTITRPWQRHRVGAPGISANRYSWVIVDVGMRRPNQPWHWPAWLLYGKEGLARLTETLRQNEQPVWRAEREVGRCFEMLDEIVGRGVGDTNLARLKIAINEIVLCIAEMLEARKPPLDERLHSSERTVSLFLEELPRRVDEPWTLDSMAGQCGIGRRHFGACCQKLANVSPIEYLTRCRLERAVRMLQDEPGRSITDIAFACGFQSSQYFAKVFRDRYGRSPREMRLAAISKSGSERSNGFPPKAVSSHRGPGRKRSEGAQSQTS